MIPIDEVRRIAGALELEPSVIDHDYVLGCYLCFLGAHATVWNYGGSPRSVRIHVNRDESLVFPTNVLSIFHQYSDRKELPSVAIQVYSLEEMMAEKLRAFSGQRKHAIPHDIFDLYHLSKNVTSVENVLEGFPLKCKAKGLSPDAIDLDKVVARRFEYENNWLQSLEYLVPTNLKVPFEAAWDTSIRLLEKASQKS